MKYFGKKKFIRKKNLEKVSLDDPKIIFEIERNNYQDYLKNKGKKYSKKSFDRNHLENVFTNKRYYNAMKRVPKEEKYVLCLYFIDEKSLDEICRELNKSKCEVIKLKTSAINHFKENYKKGGTNYE